MVKEVGKYKCEISGREFDDEEKAKEWEDMNRDIQDRFSFYESPSNPDNCQFENGHYCAQRDKEFLNRILDGIIAMTNKHYKWITKETNFGKLTRERVQGQSWLGRYLDDSGYPLYRWWGIQAQICPVCFREYGQPYYAINCTHDGYVSSYGQRTECPAKEI